MPEVKAKRWILLSKSESDFRSLVLWFIEKLVAVSGREKPNGVRRCNHADGTQGPLRLGWPGLTCSDYSVYKGLFTDQFWVILRQS